MILIKYKFGQRNEIGLDKLDWRNLLTKCKDMIQENYPDEKVFVIPDFLDVSFEPSIEEIIEIKEDLEKYIEEALK